MLDALRRLFDTRVAQPQDAPAEVQEHALRVAAAALMFEIVRADASVRDEERTVMRASLQGSFGLTAEETDELMRLAEQQSREAARSTSSRRSSTPGSTPRRRSGSSSCCGWSPSPTATRTPTRST